MEPQRWFDKYRFLLLLAGLQAVAAYREAFSCHGGLLCVLLPLPFYNCLERQDYYRNNHLFVHQIAFLFVVY